MLAHLAFGQAVAQSFAATFPVDTDESEAVSAEDHVVEEACEIEASEIVVPSEGVRLTD